MSPQLIVLPPWLQCFTVTLLQSWTPSNTAALLCFKTLLCFYINSPDWKGHRLERLLFSHQRLASNISRILADTEQLISVGEKKKFPLQRISTERNWYLEVDHGEDFFAPFQQEGSAHVQMEMGKALRLGLRMKHEAVTVKVWRQGAKINY